jgi:hypothetical protein
MADFCVIADVQAITQVTYSGSTLPTSTQVSSWIADITAFIEEQTGRKYASQTTTAEKHSGDGSPFIMLDNYPLLTVTTLIVDGTTLTSGTGYWIADAKAGIIECLSSAEQREEGESDGHENITVTYTWGASAVPASIKEYCAVLVAMKALSASSIASTSSGALKSYSDGDVSLTYQDGDKVAASLIETYERVKSQVPRKLGVAVGGIN